MKGGFIYDTIKYPSLVFEHIRPDRLAAMAALHGLAAPAEPGLRVLELGCGDGANLISIAHSMPKAKFVGVDLSGDRIREGKVIADRVRSRNIELRHEDVMDLDPAEIGRFDIVIAHGLFSWVPEQVRTRVLFLFRECLAANGFGFISFNAFPGWRFRTVIREAMRFYTDSISDPGEKVHGSVGIIRFLAGAARPGTVYKTFLETELKSLEARLPESIFHDHLSEENQPFYFTEFVQMLKGAGLQFLAESEPVAHFTNSLPQYAQDELVQLQDSPVRREQLIDFIRCNKFRSPLICRDDVEVNYLADPKVLSSLYFSSRSITLTSDPVLYDDSAVTFSAPRESEFTTNHAFTKTLLPFLNSKWPERVDFPSIVEALKRSFSSIGDEAFDAEIERTKSFLLDLYHANIVEIYYYRPEFVLSVPELPRVSTFAKWQAENGFDYVTGVLGTSIPIENDVMRAIIMRSDGSMNVSQIIEEVGQMFELPANEREDFDRLLPEVVHSHLVRFIGPGILVEG